MTLSDEPDRGPDQVPRPEESGKPGGIILQGYLYKLKRMKKKYFILFDQTDNAPTRLEYFDSEKKWKNGQSPKRSISIKECFNISKRSDCKQKLALGLYTRDDCFSVVFENEDELKTWFYTMLQIQLEGQIPEGEELKPLYDHVWQVTVRNKELASRKNIVGPHRLCLTSRVLKLVKMPMSCTSGGTNPVDLNSPDIWEFPLMNIRRCGYKNCHFFMELGRGSVTGAGELWMEAEEAATAHSMHAMIVDAMRNCAKEDLAPRQRTRSSSANEQNRPTNFSWNNPPVSTASIRSRADSVPSQQSQPYRTRTISDGVTETSGRPESSGRALSVYLDASPPAMSSPAGSMGLYLNESAASSFSNDDYDTHLALQMAADGARGGLHSVHGHRFSHTATPENSLPKDLTILEEGSPYPDYLSMSIGLDGTPHDTSNSADYLAMTPRASSMLSSSPSARSISSALGRSTSSVATSGGIRPAKTRPSFSSPPIKPALHQNPYMEMTSPVTPPTASWSPPNHSDNGNYMPMQPGTRSGTHTRSSSLGEDVPDGYVPMAPQSVASSLASRDGHLDEPGPYMDMSRWNTGNTNYRRSVPRDVTYGARGRLSPASSSSLASSMTSGTPSVPFGTPPLPSGMPGRFNEYHLEKVASLLTPSEDDDELSSLRCRQLRAYSVGSRPELAASRRKIAAKLEAAGSSPAPGSVSGSSTSAGLDVAARVRAYSVGSRVTAPSASNGQLSADSSLNSSRHEVGAASASAGVPAPSGPSADEAQRKKSMSVPTLGSSPVSVSWSNQTGTFLRNLLGTRRENDLMEMDFAAGATPESEPKGHYTSNDSLIGGGSVAGMDQIDGHRSTDLSYLAAFGSSDSVGRASVSSTNSGGGRPRPSSRSSSVLSGRTGGAIIGTVPSAKTCGSKLQRERGSKSGRPELERLESVPQGRDQDYIEYGENKSFITSPDENPSTTISRPSSSSSKNAASRKGEDNDSADEYVELARPSSALAHTTSRKSKSRSSVPRVSVTESEGQQSPLSDYMAMDFSKSTPPSSAPIPAALQAVACQIVREAQALPSNGNSGYMDMTYPAGKQTPSSQPASVSDGESYLPMDFTPTPTPKSSRNPSRQSSQVDLGLALAALSPARGMGSGTQTPRSGTQSARHSRTEETLQEHYMEMTFNHSESSQSLRGSDKSVRTRGPSPYGKSESDASGALTDSEATGNHKTGTASRATAFLSNLLGRKNSTASSASKSPPVVAESSGTLPRSSRSMPPSPFSSLKRPKSSKKRRSTANQSTPPVSPDLEQPIVGFHHQRSSSLRSTACTRPTALISVSSVTSRSLCSPLTPPSPIADFSRIPTQFSPPLPVSGHPSSRPGSTQPISIALQRPTSSLTPRGSPVSGPEFYRRNLGMRTPDPDEYVLPPPPPVSGGRYSTSPGRAFTVPTLSPLPEVNSFGPSTESNGTSGQPSSKKKKNSAALTSTPLDGSSYVNMNFSPKVNNIQAAKALPVALPAPVPLPPPPSPVKTTPAPASVKKSNTATLPAANPVLSATPTPATTAPVVAVVSAAPTKQRANSLEKIVGALEKVKIGPKRHSSGDKPLKRPSGTLIYRSNSYQPTGSRVVVAGSGKSASIFPLLSEIPAGKMIVSASSSFGTTGSESAGIQVPVASGGKNSAKSPSHPSLCTNRTSSSSLASLGEELVLNAEMQAVPWAEAGCHSSISASPALFSTATNSSSPSSSLSSRPTSVLGNDKEVLYAQLDLAPPSNSFRPAEEADEVPKSPRLRPGSVVGFTDAILAAASAPAPSTGTTYVQIDFKKSEGLKAQPRV